MSQKVINAFTNVKTYKGLTGFDKDYIDRKVIPIVKKTGPNETDYIIVLKKIDSKKSIYDCVNAEVDSVGVYNVLKQLIRENGEQAVNQMINDSKVNVSDINNAPINDISDMPTNLMEAVDKVNSIKDIYNSLPKDITAGKDIVEFFKNYNPDQIKKYFDDKARVIISKDSNLNKKKIEPIKTDKGDK